MKRALLLRWLLSHAQKITKRIKKVHVGLRSMAPGHEWGEYQDELSPLSSSSSSDDPGVA